MEKIKYYVFTSRPKYLLSYGEKFPDYPTEIEREDWVLSNEPSFINGGLFYFKKNEFEYLVLSKNKNGQYHL